MGRGIFPGDFDCVVDFADFSIFAPAWLTEQNEPDYDPSCNINAGPDTCIDTSDLAVIAKTG